jgi:hypothetical protein
MRSMMLATLLLTGCACFQKKPCQIGTVIREGPPQIVETLPPVDNPLPPPGLPTSFPKVRVTEVNPIPIYPPPKIDVPEFNEPPLKFPLPQKKVDKNIKLILVENPPYNGPPNIGCEILIKW